MRPAPLLLAALALFDAAPAAAAEPQVLESEHYRITAWPPFPEGEEYLRVAEALHARLKVHFGAEPKVEGKLEVLLWPDREGYLAGGRKDGIPDATLAAGGVYWTGTRRAYFWRQPSASFTRHLFVHELTHQFHFLAVMENRARCPGWYSEGIAEYFGTHRWDGTALTPASDVVGLEEDVPRMAEEGRAGTFDLEAILEGKRGADKPPSWAAVHYFLASGDAKAERRFRAAERAMWRGATGKAGVDTLLGPDPRATKAAARAHLASLRTTWKIEWIGWDALGSDLVGESGVVGLIRTRDPAPPGEAFVEAAIESSASAGLVLGFRSTDDFLAVYLRPGGRVEVVRRAAGKWETIGSADGVAGTRLRARLDPRGTLRVTAGEATVLDLPVGEQPGPVGLFVDGGRAIFRDVRIPGGGGK